MSTAVHIKKALLITLLGLRKRLFRSTASVVGTAGVVVVFIAIFSIAEGYENAHSFKGSEDNYMIFRAGAKSELESSLSGDVVNLLRHSDLIKSDKDGEKLVSAESYVIVNIEDKATSETMNVALRGVEHKAFQLREGLSIVEGRTFQAGKREIIVGKKAQAQFANLEIGDNQRFGNSIWKVVGVFEADGTVLESEIWTDNPMIQSAYHRADVVQVAYARFPDGISPTSFENSLNKDPRVNVQAILEADYYSDQSEMLKKFIGRLGYSIGILMMLGAIFGAVNTNMSTIVSRTREIATLEMLGMKRIAVLSSVVFESILLTFAGAFIGGTLVYLVFDGYTTSTLFFSKSFSQVVFTLDVSLSSVVQAGAIALFIGVSSSLLPAQRIISVPLVRSLSERR